MRIVSTELRQVFRAYTKQLRGEYERANASKGHESVARGFERVDISPEALSLSQELQENPPPAALAVEERTELGSEQQDENSSENDEKDETLPKEAEGSGRNIEIEN